MESRISILILLTAFCFPAQAARFVVTLEPAGGGRK